MDKLTEFDVCMLWECLGFDSLDTRLPTFPH
jgi:hypothetical protein